MKSMHWQATLAAGITVLAITQVAAEEVATLKGDRVNVRGEASVNSEVITQLRAGEKVTVLEEITVEKPKPGEPAKWARILLPANTPVWVHTLFLDPETKTVKSTRLNVRAGPGENFSVVGRLEKGATVKEIRTVEHWMEIEPPANAFAFVAANFLEKATTPAKPAEPVMAESKSVPQPVKPARPVDTTTPAPSAKPPPPIVTIESIKAEPPPAPVVDAAPPAAVMLAQPVKSAPVKAPEVEAPPAVAKAPAVVAPPPPVEPPPPVIASEPVLIKAAPQRAVSTLPSALVTPPPISAPPVPEPLVSNEPPPRRTVSREGVVRRTWSIQAPTPFVLEDVRTGKTINYLYTEDSGLELKYYSGKRILISGEEKVDPRWPATPLITIKTLENVR